MTIAPALREDRELGERRSLGAFYTPERLSSILTNWAIQSAADTVLEPSFGGCGFLQSARERLLGLGSASPREQIYGCDIDPVAFEYLASVLGSPVDLDRFVQADFLDVNAPHSWPQAFTTIIANPPYIPYQSLGTDRRNELSTRLWNIPGVRGRASLWAYFVAHSVSFLAPGGRMAWVLPGAFLQADYARPIRQYLGKHFHRAAAFVLRERMFLDEGTDEETVILFADGHLRQPKSAAIELGEATSLADLVEVIASWDSGLWEGRRVDLRPASLSLLDTDNLAFEEISRLPECSDFGTLANVRIGLVTGANPFFVLAASTLAAVELKPQDCERVMAKFHAAKGVTFNTSDHKGYLANGGHGYLVSEDGTGSNPRLARYIATFDPLKKANVSTFKKRKKWAKTNDGNVPDAFFPVMHHAGPRLVLNHDACNCTNTIHRVYFNEPTEEARRKLIAISLLTSFSQLSAELVGRRYGSGVLKHEPREAEKIRILMPIVDQEAVEQAFVAIDLALRRGENAEAGQLADALIFPALDITGWRQISKALTLAVQNIRARRRPERSRSKFIAEPTPPPTLD